MTVEPVAPTKFELVVGMEVHAQALTRSKMFCRCGTDYQGAPPNTRTSPAVGATMPSNMRIVVVLPAPLRPKNA